MRAALAVALLLVAGCSAAPIDAPAPSGALQPSRCHANAGLPDPTCTPGAANPAVTQATIGQTICVRGWTATVRPPLAYTAALKNRQKIEYGETAIPNAGLEEDHLIPLELGGAPRDPRNLWPEPRTGYVAAGRAAGDKDRVENALRVEVCAGRLMLAEAQRQIAADWKAGR